MQTEGQSYILTDIDLNKFRTKRCVKHEMTGMCPNGPECFDIHCDRSDWNDESFIRPNNSRRPPFACIERRELRYLNVLCTKVNPNAKAKSVDSSKCKSAHDCPYCHTWEEYLYHPMNYKMMLCPSRNSGGRCNDPFCSSFHTLDDISKRPKQRWTIRVKKHIKLAEVPQSVEIIKVEAFKKSRPNVIDGILYNRKHKPVTNRTRRSSMPNPCVGNGFVDYAYAQTLVTHSSEGNGNFKMTYPCADSVSESSTRPPHPQLQNSKPPCIMDANYTNVKPEHCKYLKSPAQNPKLGIILSPSSATTIDKSPSCSSIYSI